MATAGDWAQFAQTGSVYDYLRYKQNTQQEGTHADSDNGSGAAAGETGGGRPDPDPADP